MAKPMAGIQHRAQARELVCAAQEELSLAITHLRQAQALVGGDRIFRIIHALESRLDQRDDCLGATYNLDDALRHLRSEGSF